MLLATTGCSVTASPTDFRPASLPPRRITALEVLKQSSVDLVVTDLNMPVMDGEALLLEIKGSTDWKKIPVIVITSTSNDVREKTLREVGAEAVISKPVNPAVLHAAWQKICGAK